MTPVDVVPAPSFAAAGTDELYLLCARVEAHTAAHRGASLKHVDTFLLEDRVRAHTRSSALRSGLPLILRPGTREVDPASLKSRLLHLPLALQRPAAPTAAPTAVDASPLPAPRAEILLALAQSRAALQEWHELTQPSSHTQEQ